MADQDPKDVSPVTIRVCGSLSCTLAGADKLLSDLRDGADPSRLTIIRVPCIGRCAEAPAALVGDRAVGRATAEAVHAAADSGDTGPQIKMYVGLEAYREAGGYGLLDACRAGAVSVETLLATLAEAGLRGLGSMGTPVAEKWARVRSFPGPRIVVVNGNEREPGSFKDRHFLELDPHRMLEGALIAAHAVEADRIVIQVRAAYAAVHDILAREIAALEETGIAGPVTIALRHGGDGYVCGEETAMLEALEGRPCLPRRRPPEIAEAGLFGRPTLSHNVETLWWVRDIVEQGAEWFAGLGKPGHTGLRSYSVSGRVRTPGVKVAPAGISLTELIARHCGGMADGHTLSAFLPGGAAGGIFPASMADLPLDFGTFERHGGTIGAHAVVVLSRDDDPKAVARDLAAFFRDESCGQCPACRTGTETLVTLLDAEEWDAGLIGALEQELWAGSLCGLGRAAATPARTVLSQFSDETTT